MNASFMLVCLCLSTGSMQSRKTCDGSLARLSKSESNAANKSKDQGHHMIDHPINKTIRKPEFQLSYQD
uniref:Secreted protein n=1 Tax=Steinernema glaseri TaxID=37863 RepID=A0A1I7Z743_9BILA